jgi:hypothetical protein
METKMKTKWAVLAGSSAMLVLVATGCFDTSGGSSSNDGPGSTNKPVVVQISFNVPDCSASSPALFNGAAFGGGAGYLYIAPSCPNADDHMYVWIKVMTDVAPSQVASYTWTIQGWTDATNNGVFTADTYNGDPVTNGVFEVQTTANQIRYQSPSVADLLSLASVSNQKINVTVMTKDGQFTSGYISLKLHSGVATGANLVYGALASQDSRSNLRLANYADYYTITNTGGTNVLSMEGADFATTLVLYDTNLTAVATNEGLFSGSLTSRIISTNLALNTPYFVEATTAGNGVTGNYWILNSTGQLTPTPNPFLAASCNNIAATYAVNEATVIDLAFNGQSDVFTNYSATSVTISQDGCSFWYSVNDPTGLVPPMVRMGRVINSATLELYSDSFFPQCPELVITSSSVEGSGTQVGSGWDIQSLGAIGGSFLSSPFTLNYASGAAFTR